MSETKRFPTHVLDQKSIQKVLLGAIKLSRYRSEGLNGTEDVHLHI